MDTKQQLESTSFPSTALTSDVEVVKTGATLALRVTFDRDGQDWTGGIAFASVRAYRWRAEGHCTEWHIQDAYDTVVEINDSSWVAELRADSGPNSTWPMHHFMVFLDGAGCFEAAATSWEMLEEVPVDC